MEYLDIYDENDNFLGKEERSVVHSKGLWHHTVHCWLYDKEGNVLFQRRKDEGTLYTTASGHLKASETMEEGFQREIKEEIGISVQASDATLVSIVPYVMDKKMKDGSMFRDRAKAYVYVLIYESTDFQLDPEEVSSLVSVNASQTLKIFEQEKGTVKGKEFFVRENELEIVDRDIDFSEFLVNSHETALEKYGEVLRKIVSLTK